MEALRRRHAPCDSPTPELAVHRTEPSPSPSLSTTLAGARHFDAVRAELHEIHGLMIEALALVSVPQRVANDAPGDLRPEIVAVVEAVDGLDHVFLRKAGIFEVRKLVAAIIGDGFAG